MINTKSRRRNRPLETSEPELRVALLGNPNSGKTTLFNALTGSRAHVGNFPGVTVEKREGVCRVGARARVTDLPGIYSLAPYSPEEIVTRDFLLGENPSVVIDVVDATNLERNLYLTTQLLEIDLPVVVALNMTDVLKREGDELDAARLERALGVPVAEISALKGTGIENLMQRAAQAAKQPRKGWSVLSRTEYAGVLGDLLSMYRQKGVRDPLFHAVQLFEGEERERRAFPEIAAQADLLKENLAPPEFGGDFEAVTADARYRVIAERFSPALRKKRADGMNRSARIDRVLTHPVFGIPIFLALMFLVFHLTFGENFLFLSGLIPEGSFDSPILGKDAIPSPGVLLTNCAETGTDALIRAVASVLPEGSWVTGLVCEGLLAGVCAVLCFLPQILCLFLFLSLLEDSGYMARVAFLLDRAFRRFGLSGRAFVPLLTCFGCAVPGILATRTLENEDERRTAILLAPFFSCGAKLPVWATFGAALFGGAHADLVISGMYALGLAVAVCAAFFLRKGKGEASAFLMELPAYRLPQFRNTMLHLWEKLKHYLSRAATVIAGAVVVVWVLSHFDFAFRMTADMGDSMIGRIAKFVSPLFAPLGFGGGESGWKFVVALFTGFIAKEMVVATLGAFAGAGEGALAGLIGALSVPAALAFLAFNLLSMPCMAAVAAARGELGGGKKLGGAILFWMTTAYLVSELLYLTTSLPWAGAALAALVLLGFGFKKIIYPKRKKKHAVV